VRNTGESLSEGLKEPRPPFSKRRGDAPRAGAGDAGSPWSSLAHGRGWKPVPFHVSLLL